MISVLCYGDSNTYGFIPGSGGRYPENVRYPGKLAMLLGEGYRVIEEGCNGRTALCNEEPVFFQAGTDYMRKCFEKNAPVDIVILITKKRRRKRAVSSLMRRSVCILRTLIPSI